MPSGLYVMSRSERYPFIKRLLSHEGRGFLYLDSTICEELLFTEKTHLEHVGMSRRLIHEYLWDGEERRSEDICRYIQGHPDNAYLNQTGDNAIRSLLRLLQQEHNVTHTGRGTYRKQFAPMPYRDHFTSADYWSHSHWIMARIHDLLRLTPQDMTSGDWQHVYMLRIDRAIPIALSRMNPTALLVTGRMDQTDAVACLVHYMDLTDTCLSWCREAIQSVEPVLVQPSREAQEMSM